MNGHKFTEDISVGSGFDVPSLKWNSRNITNFYQDGLLFRGCKTLSRLIRTIGYFSSEEIQTAPCEVFLPLSTRSMPLNEMLSLIEEDVVSLYTTEGLLEAKERLIIFSHLLTSASVNNSDFEGSTALGIFKYPAFGKYHEEKIAKPMFTLRNGEWTVSENVIANIKTETDPIFFFSRSQKLRTYVSHK